MGYGRLCRVKEFSLRVIRNGGITMRKNVLLKSTIVMTLLVLACLFCNVNYAYAKDMPENPKYNENTGAGRWDYVYFGRYPQTEVTGDELTSAIKNAIYNENGDAIVDGIKYRKETRGYNADKRVCYFRYEPIKWRVLKNDGNSLLLLADSLLCFGLENSNKDVYYYESSVQRSILNGYDEFENERNIDFSGTDASFIDMAFYENEKEILEVQEISSEDVTDYVIIPSITILKGNEYGFGSDYSRIMKKTDYSLQSSYVWCYENQGNMYGCYSPDGTFLKWGMNDNTSIIPLIQINLDSDLWSMECPETSYIAKDIKKATVKLSKTEYTYDGKEKKPKVTVKDNGETLVENIDYKLTYKNNIKAGTASVEIYGLGQHAGIITKTFTIHKKEQEISVKDKYTKYYGDASFKLDVMRKKGDGKITYTSSNKKVATVNKYGTVKIVGGGETVITINVAETKLYRELSVDVKLTVKNKVKYQLNGGKNNSKNPTVYFNKSITLKAPTKKGYEFKGWYTDKEFKNKIKKLTTKTKKNTTIYAKWEKIKVGDTEILSLKNKKGKKITIEIDEVKKADGYQIIYATNKSFKNKKTVYVEETNIVLEKLKKNKTYYVKVRAYRLDSTKKKVYGEFSEIMSIKIKK